ncbi:MAG: 50S ribosomal protein L37ae [Nanoarchaeota archaeon]|nr:50S ribosomal protein L37ae [Nanoarchaeota archaeon]MBU0962729.1 50S ribosomal protein L37ae [Nanoarchaeota archaeon]
MVGTKKVKSAGRFGSRYGKGVRQRVIDIEQKQRKKKKCPYCKKTGQVKRLAAGIWHCKKCKKKFTNKAYFVE